jgi:transcriptional regulator with XRE-family HTH domain
MEKRSFYATKELKQSREARGLSQAEMTQILSVLLSRKINLVTYQKWEQGINSVKLDDAVAISRELKRPIDELWEAR